MLEGSAWATLGVSEQADCFGDAVVLPCLFTCAGLAVTGEGVVDGGHRVVRGVPRMPAHMGGSGRLPGGASSGTGCRVGGAAGGSVCGARDLAGLADANLAAWPACCRAPAGEPIPP